MDSIWKLQKNYSIGSASSMNNRNVFFFKFILRRRKKLSLRCIYTRTKKNSHFLLAYWAVFDKVSRLLSE
jgi:hypothetical protein